MKLTLYHIILLCLVNFAPAARQKEPFETGFRFRSVKCTTDNVTAFTNFCFLKAISRRFTTLNISFNFTRPLDRPIDVQQIFRKKLTQSYHTMIDTKRVEWCDIMEGKGRNIVLQLVIDMVKGSAPGIFHKCPYESLVATNLTLDSSMLDESHWIPGGIFATDILIWKGAKLVIAINVTNEMKVSRENMFKLDKVIKQWV
jgi:hypothetical protein